MTVLKTGSSPGIGDGRGLAAAGRADEEIVLSSDRQGSDGALGGIIVELGGTVHQPGLQLLHPRETIADRRGKRRLAGYPGELGLQPGVEVLEHGP